MATFSANLRTLEEAGYISSEKFFMSRRPVTQFAMTEAGRLAFRALLGRSCQFAELKT